MNDQLPAIPETDVEKVEDLSDDVIVQRSGFTALRTVILLAMDELEELKQAGDLETMMYGHAGLDLVARDVRTLQRDVRTAIHDELAANDQWEAIVSGLGIFSRTYTGKVVTDWDTLIPDLRRQALFDEQGSEIDDPAEAVDRMIALVRAVTPMTSSVTAKVGGLKDAGLDPDNYREKMRDGKSIRFDPSNAEKKKR